MSRSFLATIRQAMTPEPFAAAPAPTGAAHPSSDDADPAITAARAEGAAAATARFLAIMADDKLKSDPHLMAAAIDLAAKSDMPGPEIVTFVTANVVAPAAAAKSSASLAARIAEIEAGGDPLGAALGGYLPPASADGWREAMGRAAGRPLLPLSS